MTPRILTILSMMTVAALGAGCSADGGTTLATASVAPEKVATAPKIDPICVSLASQIDGLRKEGTVERLEQAAAGKSASVQVKRASLAKQAELNKANADFQAKCGPKIPAAQTAQVAPGAAHVAPVATASAAPAAAVAPKN